MRTCSQKNTGELLGPTEVSLHTRAVCLRHLRLGSFLTGSGCRRTTSVSCHFRTHAPQQITLLDHLVGARKYQRRDGDAERLCSLEVDDQLVFCWLLDGEIGGLGTSENFIHIYR
jgi:hypothetical protein